MPRKNIGPGPGKYLLPPAIGFNGHDFSRRRNPCYSIGLKLHTGTKPQGPGPAYSTANMTRRGKYNAPAYSMKMKPKDLTMFRPPGPGAYAPERVPVMRTKRPPVYSLRFRYAPLRSLVTPGPDKYEAPTCIGPKIPDKTAKGAYSMSFKHYLKDVEKSPGPANYGSVDIKIFKQKPPNYTISPRIFPPGPRSLAPGPKYFPKLSQIPGYSMGHRTDNDPYITADDQIPCIKRKPCPKKGDDLLG